MDLTHREAAELLGAYALDAVDGDEGEAVARHVAACPRCRGELSEHREVAAWLANAGSEAPAGVWDRIAASLEERPPRLDLERLRSGRPKAPWRRRALGAVAAAAVIVVGLVSAEAVHQAHRADRLAAAEGRAQLRAMAAAAAADPSARSIVLRSPDGGRTARAVLLPDGTGYFTASTLPAARAGRAYQLWALDGPKAMSARVLGRRVAPAVFTLAAPASGLAITEEQAGGAAAPTGPPLVAASVPRG